MNLAFALVFLMILHCTCHAEDQQAPQKPGRLGISFKDDGRATATGVEKERFEKADEQTARYLELVDEVGSALINLIRTYDLTEELALSESQIDELSKVRLPLEVYAELPESLGPISMFPSMSIPSPALTKMILCRGKDFPLTDSEFKKFEARFHAESRRHAEIVDDLVAAIFSAEQLKRLRQIGFQSCTVLHSEAHAAFAYHEIKLSQAERREMARNLAKVRDTIMNSQSALEFAEKLNFASDVIGANVVAKAAGDIFSFGKGPEWAEVCARQWPKQTNPNRDDRLRHLLPKMERC